MPSGMPLARQCLLTNDTQRFDLHGAVERHMQQQLWVVVVALQRRPSIKVKPLFPSPEDAAS